MVYKYGLIAELIGNANVTEQAYTDQFKNPKYPWDNYRKYTHEVC